MFVYVSPFSNHLQKQNKTQLFRRMANGFPFSSSGRGFKDENEVQLLVTRALRSRKSEDKIGEDYISLSLSLPPPPFFSQREKERIRKDDSTIAPTSFLWSPYYPDRYYFEVGRRFHFAANAGACCFEDAKHYGANTKPGCSVSGRRHDA